MKKLLFVLMTSSVRGRNFVATTTWSRLAISRKARPTYCSDVPN